MFINTCVFLYIVYVAVSFNSSVNVCSRNAIICDISYPVRPRLRQLSHIQENSYSFENSSKGVCLLAVLSPKFTNSKRCAIRNNVVFLIVLYVYQCNVIT